MAGTRRGPDTSFEEIHPSPESGSSPFFEYGVSLGVNPPEKRLDRNNPESGRLGLRLEHPARQHTDFVTGSLEPRPEFPLKRMKPVFPIERNDGAVSGHTCEFGQGRDPVFSPMQMMKKAQRQDDIRRTRLEGKTGRDVGDETCDFWSISARIRTGFRSRTGPRLGPGNHGLGNIGAEEQTSAARRFGRDLEHPPVAAGCIKNNRTAAAVPFECDSRRPAPFQDSDQAAPNRAAFLPIDDSLIKAAVPALFVILDLRPRKLRFIL